MKLLRRAMYMDGTKPALWKGLVAGALGGLAGTAAMSAFQELWSTAQHELTASEKSKKPSAGSQHGDNGHQREENRLAQPYLESPYLAEGSEAQGFTPARRQGNGSPPENESEPDGPLEKTAARIASIARLELSPSQRHNAGLFVHYAFGTLLGAGYGAAMELAPELVRKRKPTSWLGLGYGTAVFFGADEIALPSLELTGKFSEMPLSSHVYGFASHLVYGLVAEITRRAIRNSL